MKTYIISDGQRVKIGRSNNPDGRRKQLQTAHASTLVLLLSLDDNREKELHQRFAKHRERGEWFTLAADIQAFIDDPTLPYQLPVILYTPRVERERRIRKAEVKPLPIEKWKAKPRISANEIIQRFDITGGRVHHFVGRKTCYATTLQRGNDRFRFEKQSLISTLTLIDPACETYTMKSYNEAVKVLIARAKELQPKEPRLSMETLRNRDPNLTTNIEEYLDFIDAKTLPSTDEIHGAINQWCRFIEVVASQASEIDSAFRRDYYAQHLLPILDRYAAQMVTA